MLTKLTLGEKLKDLRIAKGYKSTEHLASVVNIPKTTLNDYENDEKNQDVGYANLITLAKFYEVSMDYLLGLSDVDKHLNIEYMNLGLDDDVINLLRERKVNTRLLCDLILNPNFTDFMADIEIYIDGLISMRITALNTQLQATRTLLKHKRNVPEEDINMRTMLLGQFDETRYFRSIIGEDIDKILYSLREKYKKNTKDNTVTSSDVDLGEMSVKAVEQYQRLEGSTVEKQVELLSSFTGIKAEKMTEDDKKAHGSFLKMLSKFWKKL